MGAIPKTKRRGKTMTWLQVGLLAVSNFVSIFIAVSVLRYLDYRKKKKVAEIIIDQLEKKISNEISFQNIVREMREDI
jgi:hypothetical protein